MIIDFSVKWQGNEEKTSKEITKHLICKKLKAGMPVVIGVVGKSQVGKTMWALKIQDWVYEYFGLKFSDFMDKCVLIKPRDWTKKVRPIIENTDPEIKKIKSVHLDEAKFLINTDDWQKLHNRGTRAIIGVSAAIHPLLIVVVAQIRKDIDPRVRETLDFLFEVSRSPSNKPRIICKIPYEKVYDLSNIKILMRGLRGMINYPDGESVLVFPVFSPTLPRKEIIRKYRAFEIPDKQAELVKIMDKMDKSIRDLEGNTGRIRDLIDLFVENPQELELAGEWDVKKNRWRLSRDARKKFEIRHRKDALEIEEKVSSALSAKTVSVEVVKEVK